MMTASLPLSWSELPPDLLGLILKRLPSLADRVRLRTVCHPWRLNAQLQPLPPLLPWLSLLDGTFLNIPDGKIFQIPVPDGASCCGSIDNWLFLMQSDGRCSLMNPFSKATLDLPNIGTVRHRDWVNTNDIFKPVFYKLVVPSPLDISPDSLVAVLITEDCTNATICICQLPTATDLFVGKYKGPLYRLNDTEFFGGKLYGATFWGKLLIIEIADGLESEPNISSAQCIIDSTDHFDSRPEHLPGGGVAAFRIIKYLVKCEARLLMVERWLSEMDPGLRTGPDYLEHESTVAFQVFDADLSTNSGRWKKVSKLGGQALLVGQHCSKSFPAGECNGIQDDCIYFMCDYTWPRAADPLLVSGVYNIKTGVIMSLLSETAAVPLNHGGQCRPAWFFPAESM